MGLAIGIVGLPNVGKSTLFNALLGQAQAQAANYPFCTIDPNIGVVPVPDERLVKLAVAQLRAEVADLAVSAAGRIVKSSLDEKTQRQLVDEYIKDLPAGRA